MATKAPGRRGPKPGARPQLMAPQPLRMPPSVLSQREKSVWYWLVGRAGRSGQLPDGWFVGGDEFLLADYCQVWCALQDAKQETQRVGRAVLVGKTWKRSAQHEIEQQLADRLRHLAKQLGIVRPPAERAKRAAPKKRSAAQIRLLPTREAPGGR